MVLEQIDTLQDARQVAQKLLLSIATPIAVNGAETTVGASIGIALYQPGSGQPAATVIAEADTWMYRAKRAGKGRILPE